MFKKKRTALILFLILFLPAALYAQLDKTEEVRTNLTKYQDDTTAWLYGVQVTAGFNQGFLHNWSAGGELISLSVNSLTNAYLTRLHRGHVWNSTLDMSYGLFYAYSNHFVPRKLDDRLDVGTRYGVPLSRKHRMLLSGLANFKSQFTEGYDYNMQGWRDTPTSHFMAPAYLTVAVGLEYRKEPQFSFFLSPLATRITLVSRRLTERRLEGAYGVKYGKTYRQELGAYASIRANLSNKKKTLTYVGRADLYSNYLAKNQYNEAGELVKRDHPSNVDFLLDQTLTFKTSTYMAVGLGLTLLYDNDVPYRPGEARQPGEYLGWLQVKQLLTLGLTFKI